MKILIVSEKYYPQKNGVQCVTQYQAEGLAQLGHQVTVITSIRHSPVEHEWHNGVEIVRIDALTDFMLYFGDKSRYLELLKTYSKQVDVIMTVCIESWTTDWALQIIDELNCAKVMMIHGIHDFRWSTFKDRSLYGIVRKMWGDIRWRPFFTKNWGNIKKYNSIIQLHEEDFATIYFRKHGVNQQEILYNAVDDQFFETSKEKCNQIVNVGSYSPRKNQIACLKAFYMSDAKDWKLVLIGSSKNNYYEKVIECRSELEKKYGHRDVDIKVNISREETIEELKRSKIYLLTSISEMFPVSLLEGMASGCAWISTDVGINRYLPGGEICNTISKMAEKITALVVNNAWEELGRKGQCFASENCQKNEQVRKLENILLRAVEESKMEI